ncbi:MAG: hypothetical protein MZV65_54480 [Chromatiales bacterium]|nr:hypothetical protein [Chromatiales bacterium]
MVFRAIRQGELRAHHGRHPAGADLEDVLPHALSWRASASGAPNRGHGRRCGADARRLP